MDFKVVTESAGEELFAFGAEETNISSVVGAATLRFVDGKLPEEGHLDSLGRRQRFLW